MFKKASKPLIVEVVCLRQEGLKQSKSVTGGVGGVGAGQGGGGGERVGGGGEEESPTLFIMSLLPASAPNPNPRTPTTRPVSHPPPTCLGQTRIPLPA